MSAKSRFLLMTVIIAALAALAYPTPGAWLKELGAIRWFVITIFLINGWNLRLRGGRPDARFAKALVTGAILSLVVGPLLGMVVGRSLGLAPALLVGLVVMAAMPTTLSSAIVVTDASGGNAIWALFLTISLNLLAIPVIPFMLKFSLTSSAGVNIAAGALLLKLFTLVLLPFMAGAVARRLNQDAPTPKLVGYIPSACVALSVWVSLRVTRSLAAFPLRQLPLVMLAALGVHLTLLAAAWFLGRLLRLDTPERKAMAFTCSQKTMPIALSVLTALGGQTTGLAILVCLIFHFQQLIADAFVSTRLPKA